MYLYRVPCFRGHPMSPDGLPKRREEAETVDSILKHVSLTMASVCPELRVAPVHTGSAAGGRSGLPVPPLGGTPVPGLGSFVSSAPRERGMSGFAGSALVMREVIERPTTAPAVVAQAHAYAPANGAGAWNDHGRNEWADGGAAAFAGTAAIASKTQQTKKRAFRGLEPWRDPA